MDVHTTLASRHLKPGCMKNNRQVINRSMVFDTLASIFGTKSELYKI